MSIPQPDELSELINETRITYPSRPHGVTIKGSAFICEFENRVEPKSFCEEICTVEDPWRLFGIKTQISDEYWKVVGTLFHVTSDEITDASKFTIEVAPEWGRIYVKKGCCENRMAKFVKTLDEVYGLEAVTFAQQKSDTSNDQHTTPKGSTDDQ